jgi:hypothetical protein
MWLVVDPDGDGWTKFETREKAIDFANKIVAECKRDGYMESANRLMVTKVTHVVLGDALAVVT